MNNVLWMWREFRREGERHHNWNICHRSMQASVHKELHFSLHCYSICEHIQFFFMPLAFHFTHSLLYSFSAPCSSPCSSPVQPQVQHPEVLLCERGLQRHYLICSLSTPPRQAAATDTNNSVQSTKQKEIPSDEFKVNAQQNIFFSTNRDVRHSLCFLSCHHLPIFTFLLPIF